MLKEYSIYDLLDLSPQHIPYYAGTFEETEDPNIEWPHRHTYYSLVWFTQGSGFYVIDSSEYIIKPGRIFIVNPKQVHNWDYSDNSKGYILVVDKTLGIELNIDLQLSFVDLNQSKGSFIEPIFKNLISESNIGNNINIDIQYFYKVLERFAREKKITKVDSNPVFDKYKSSILDNIGSYLSVEDYAGNLNISVKELNIISKQITGTSAKQYLLDLKITEAKRLLLYSNLNVNEISFKIGFEDSSYFSRLFKNKTGFSPTNFSEKYRKQR